MRASLTPRFGDCTRQNVEMYSKADTYGDTNMNAPKWAAGLATSVALCTAAALPAAVHAQAALGFSSQSGYFLDSNTRMLGWQFSVPTAASVAALGWFDLAQDGLNRSHEVGIWDATTQTLLASAVVPSGTAGVLLDQFRWIDLATALTLQPGVDYRIAGLDIGSGGDGHVWDASIGYGVSVSGFAVDPAITLGAAGTALGGLASQFGFPTGVIGDARRVEMGPNFSLSLVAVPEPASALLMLAGACLLMGATARARNMPQAA
jgi:hypothetical protein